MRRRFELGLAAALIATSAAAAPLDAGRDCRVLDLRDSSRNGAPVVGAEDVVFDAAGERFLIAAFDRDQAADVNAADGGLYGLPLAALADADTRITVAPLTLGGAAPLRPHGIDVSADGETIAVVERREWEGAENRTRILRLTRDGDIWRRETVAEGIEVCRANDIAIASNDVVLPDDERFFVSLDRRACGGLGLVFENVVAFAGSRVVALSSGDAPRTMMKMMLVANGVIAYRGRLIVAETRENRLLYANHLVLPPGIAFALADRTPLGASPDNINRAPDGGLLVTAHNSLFQLALHRTFGDAFEPGGVVFHLHDADRGGETPPEPLLRIPGDIFAGPTSAAAGGGQLLVGSATAAGVLACDWSPSKEDR